MLVMSFNVFANDIYVEQVGDSSTVTLIQQGSGNRMGTPSDSVYIGSGSNNVYLKQQGDNNELDMVVNGASTNVNVTTVGSGNIQTIDCGTTVSAGCSGSDIKQTTTGDTNTITQSLGTGANHTSWITTTGDNNTITHTSTNSGTTVGKITVTGGLNSVSLTQSGLTAKNAIINTTGDSNTVSVTQSD